jgi:hypothetical protein
MKFGTKLAKAKIEKIFDGWRMAMTPQAGNLLIFYNTRAFVQRFWTIFQKTTTQPTLLFCKFHFGLIFAVLFGNCRKVFCSDAACILFRNFQKYISKQLILQ